MFSSLQLCSLMTASQLPPPPRFRHYLWFAFVCFLIRSHPPVFGNFLLHHFSIKFLGSSLVPPFMRVVFTASTVTQMVPQCHQVAIRLQAVAAHIQNQWTKPMHQESWS